MNAATRDLRLESHVERGPDVYRFRTVDGVVSPDAFRPAELALAEACWERTTDRLCVLEANYGVAGTLLASRAERVTMTETSARAARLCRQNATENGVDAAVQVVADVSTLEERFDVVVYAPKAYTPLDVGVQHLVSALATLSPGGLLFLAASKRSGLGRYRSALESRCADVERIARTGDVRVLRAERPDAVDFERHVTPTVLRPTVCDVDLELVTLPGTFAASELDLGTRLLLETVTPSLPTDGRVLDLCCGCGPIGAYVAAATNCDVWLTDECRLASWCAERTVERTPRENGTPRVVTADCLRGVDGRRFDIVLCNPPTHAGDGVLSSLFSGAADVLTPDGECWFVHHRSLDLSEHASVFDRVDRVATGREHVVFRAS
ncbi:methyltransferase [Halovivax gelatinilyticus]|uniref:methyltransferase n=1 Tax=Halovivax gelatinilyticus TaxID=2961597 RepID=UPI0020CA3E09|nr:methyltransferase [Halovivax gelatinilyticus]